MACPPTVPLHRSPHVHGATGLTAECMPSIGLSPRPGVTRPTSSGPALMEGAAGHALRGDPGARGGVGATELVSYRGPALDARPPPCHPGPNTVGRAANGAPEPPPARAGRGGSRRCAASGVWAAAAGRCGVAHTRVAAHGGLPAGPARARLCGWPERRRRLPLHGG